MTRSTRILCFALLAAGAAARGETDPIEACAAAHADEPAAHVDCLAAALRAELARRHSMSPAAVNGGAAQAAAGAGDAAASTVTVPEVLMNAPANAAQRPAGGLAGDATPVLPPAPSGLGAEQVVKADPDPASREVTVQIVAATYDARGIGTFRTADGQTWRETMPSPVHRRLKQDTHYSARIERGTFGGYRMYVDGVRRMKTVERIE